jgi:hypothetical protein
MLSARQSARLHKSKPSCLHCFSFVGFHMPDMDSVTDETGIDIQVVFSEGPSVIAGMKDCAEEIEVGEFTATFPYKLRLGVTRLETGATAAGGGWAGK